MTKETVTITARDLRLHRHSEPFTLSIEPGRITGLAGLEKSGQEDLLLVLCGLQKAFSGRIEGFGEAVASRGLRNLQEAFKHGIAYLPRDRKTEGIMAPLSVIDNFAIATLKNYSFLGFINPRRVRSEYNAFARDLGIVTASPQSAIRTLSGGNQQKVLLARWLAAEPGVLLLNDPSRGVDHPTKLAMHDLYRRLADSGTAVVLLSSEIEELMMVADSTVVFREGGVQATLARDEMTRDRVLSAMFGVASV